MVRKSKDSEVYLSLNGLEFLLLNLPLILTINTIKRLSRLFTLSRLWMLQEIKKFLW